MKIPVHGDSHASSSHDISLEPIASSADAEGIERASQKVEKRSRTSRSWFEGVSVERVNKVMPDRMRNCAWQITRRLARPCRVKKRREAVWTCKHYTSNTAKSYVKWLRRKQRLR